MPNCSVVGCSTKSDRCHHRFSFPNALNKPELLQEWLNNVNRKDCIPTVNSFVCWKHFVDGKPTPEHPCPTLNLGNDFEPTRICQKLHTVGASQPHVCRRTPTRPLSNMALQLPPALPPGLYLIIRPQATSHGQTGIMNQQPCPNVFAPVAIVNSVPFIPVGNLDKTLLVVLENANGIKSKQLSNIHSPATIVTNHSLSFSLSSQLASSGYTSVDDSALLCSSRSISSNFGQKYTTKSSALAAAVQNFLFKTDKTDNDVKSAQLPVSKIYSPVTIIDDSSLPCSIKSISGNFGLKDNTVASDLDTTIERLLIKADNGVKSFQSVSTVYSPVTVIDDSLPCSSKLISHNFEQKDNTISSALDIAIQKLLIKTDNTDLDDEDDKALCKLVLTPLTTDHRYMNGKSKKEKNLNTNMVEESKGIVKMEKNEKYNISQQNSCSKKLKLSEAESKKKSSTKAFQKKKKPEVQRLKRIQVKSTFAGHQLEIKNVRCHLCYVNRKIKKDDESKRRHAIFHLKTHSHVDWCFKCLLCKKRPFLVLHSLHRHMISQHNIKAESLQKSVHFEDRSFLYEEELERIQRLAFVEHGSNFKCRLCSRNVLALPGPLNLHVKKHLVRDSGSEWWSHKCRLCNKLFSSEAAIIKHIKIMHPLKCSVQMDKHVITRKSRNKQVHSLAFPEADEMKFRKGGACNVFYRIKCRLCDSRTKANVPGMTAHIRNQHIPNEADSIFLYKCKSCKDFLCTDESKMQSHAIVEHEVDAGSVQKKVHYTSRNLTVKEKVNCILPLAFPTAVVNLNPSKRIEYKSNMVTCCLCNVDVVAREFSTNKHVFLHLPEKTGVEWFFKCVLCDTFDTFREEHMLKHLNSKHSQQAESCRFEEDLHYVTEKSHPAEEITQWVHSLAFPDIA